MRLQYGGVVVAAGAVMGCVAIGSLFSLAVFLQPMSEATGWSRTGISSAMTLDFLTMGVAAFGWGALTDRFGPRPVVLAGALLVGMGLVVTLLPLIVATLFASRVLRMNPVVTCGALAGAMTVDAAVTGACEVAESQTPVLGVAVPYAVGNVVLTVLGPIIVAATYSG